MLSSITFHEKRFEFAKRAAGRRSGENTFTILVGKNGTGKSRLLRSIAMGFIAQQKTVPEVVDKDFGRPLTESQSAEWTEPPKRLIGVSTSPFDKFPLLRTSVESNGYSYLGLRGLSSPNLGVAYLARIVGKLMEAVVRRADTASAIASVLTYLGYEPVIDVHAHLAPERAVVDMMTPDGNRVPNEWLSAHRQIAQLSDREQRRLAESYFKVSNFTGRRRRVGLAITPAGIEGDLFAATGLDLCALLRTGLMKVLTVTLCKSSEQTQFELSEASSGEQAVVMGLLGIASQIEEGAIVLIDEPEICLHPEWQERYIHLLFEAFSGYRGCHFIIATHSPQLVAELPPGNCFVLSMEDCHLHRASAFAKRSVDFQLASLFNAPGFKNEYLLRSALGVFADITKGRELGEEARTALKLFKQVFHLLQDDDPVKELISVIFEARQRDA